MFVLTAMLMPIRAHMMDVTAPTKEAMVVGAPMKKAMKTEKSGLQKERHGLRHVYGAKVVDQHVLAEADLPDGLGHLAADVSRGTPFSRMRPSRRGR